MNYEKVAEAMYEDLATWMIANHSTSIKTFYTLLIETYLNDKMGDLNDKCHKQLTRELLKKLIV
jgi:hypothetical protein